MSNQKKGLGMGLSGLMSSDNSKKNSILEIDLNSIKPNPKQPRDFFDEDKIKELAQSIKENGLIQPVLVVKNAEIGYNLIAGERRFRAVKSLGHSKIKAILVQADEASMIKNAIIENIQREDLTTIEEALGYEMMIRELNLTHQEVAEQVGKSRSHISNMIRILSLPNEIIELISKNKISFGHAKVLLSVENPLDFIEHLQEEISVRKLEDIIKNKFFSPEKNDVTEERVDKAFFNQKNQKDNGMFAKKMPNNADYLQNIAFDKDFNNLNSSEDESEEVKTDKNSKKLIFNLIKDIYSKDQNHKSTSVLDENLIDDELDLISNHSLEKIKDDSELKENENNTEYAMYIKNLENYIHQKIGLNIKLNININNNSGSINIAYKDFEELEKILSYLF